MKWVRTCFTFLVALFTILISPGKSFPEGDMVITVSGKLNIRDIAGKYLNNPDLWEDLLRANDLKSPHEIKPGMKLRIPVQKITSANTAIKEAERLIRKATSQGAKLFTPDLIAQAILEKNKALEKRKDGDWEKALAGARAAIERAEKSLEICAGKQDVPAEAMVQDFKGNVHTRKASDDLWKNVSKNELLVEGQKIRTLSESSAEILFRDDSRLRLKENAQAMIRKIRNNLLQDTQEAQVSLIEGDVLALLAGGKKRGVKLDIPGVKTKVDSNRFWVGRDDEGARFANYEGEIEVTSAGKKVVLKKNQGTIVPKNQKPKAPLQLLPAPHPLSPENGFSGYHMDVTMRWSEIQGADHYLLELSKNASFTKIDRSESIKKNRFAFPSDLGSGTFYWRVSAVSREKLPGAHGGIRYFRVLKDDKPPFLVVKHPSDDAITPKQNWKIDGISERGASVFVNQRKVETEPDGSFSTDAALSEGDNRIIVKAVDPAGNISEITRVLTYFPEKKAVLLFLNAEGKKNDSTAYTSANVFTLMGKTNPLGVIRIRSVDLTGKIPESSGEKEQASVKFSISAKADPSGNFQINLPAEQKENFFIVEVTDLSGNRTSRGLNLYFDDQPPVIRFTSRLPSQTAQRELVVSGSVNDAVVFKINGRQIPISEDAFNESIPLGSGMNRLKFFAEDRAGNTTVIEKELYLDTNPPELIKYTVNPRHAAGNTVVNVDVVVRDETSLPRVASFSASVGSFRTSGILKIRDTSGTYSGSFRVPRTFSGKVVLLGVKLSDYIGNTREYVLNEQ